MRLNICTIITILIVSIQGLFAQKYTIKGNIKDSVAGIPLLIEGTNLSTKTDSVGNFEIEVVKSDSTKDLVNPKRFNLLVGCPQPQQGAKAVRIRDYASKSEQVLVNYEIDRFPWPPPPYSADEVINDSVFKKVNRLSGVDKILRKALDSCGYLKKRYYYVPDGFALVTKIEQIYGDGTPYSAPNRFNLDREPNFKFNLFNYIKSLFITQKGHYRLIVFIITDVPLYQSEVYIQKEDAVKWLKSGNELLPSDIGKLKYTEDYKCYALIYEFIKPDYEATLNFVNESDSSLQGRDHLMKSNLFTYLK